MHYEYSFFLHTRDNQPKPRRSTLDELQQIFCEPTIVRSKEDARLFCPAKFQDGKRRTSATVETVSLAVFDVDCGVWWKELTDDWKAKGLCFWVYTTFKSTVESPRWRAIFPLATPVAAEKWKGIWTHLSKELLHDHADAACKDAARMYYLPCCSESTESEFYSEFHPGASVNANDLHVWNEPSEVPVQTTATTKEEGQRVGDWFNENTTIDSILLPHGWRKTGKQGNLELWARPGKDGSDDTSATYGLRATMADERFYCFSSSVPGVPLRKMLTKFALYTYLNHAGNFVNASKAVARTLPKPKQPQRKPPVKSQSLSMTSQLQMVSSQGLDTDEWIRRECTDAANGERLVKEFGDQFKYVAELREWARWDGSRWHISPKAEADFRVMAVECARKTQTEARQIGNSHHAQKILTWAIKSQDTNRLSNAIREAQALLTISVSQFDQHPFILNCKNGMVDLKTGVLHPHDRKHLISQVTACEYHEDESVPVAFTSFTNRILPDESTLAFLMQFLGYSLTGVLSDQSYAFFHGATGNNGKSTLVDLMLWMLGDYAVTMDTESLMMTRGFVANSEYELARLRGKRLAVAHEVSDNQRLNEPLIKRLTGGDTVRARRPYGLPFEFRPTAKICMTGNNKPTITGQDSATWRRVNLVPFEVEVPASERDANLGNKLREEAPLILRTLVQWCLSYQEKGLIRSPSMLESRDGYREENDFMAEFISSECVFGSCYTIGCSELHQRYVEWARRTMSIPLTPTSFGRIMSQRAAALNIVKSRNAAGRKIWTGCDVVEH